MTTLLSAETEVTGEWRPVGGKMIAGDTYLAIHDLVSDQLVKRAVDSSGLYVFCREPQDTRLWELSYPQSEMHGGGPPELKCVSEIAPRWSFGVFGD
jgi:hypothetical protein